MSIEKGERNDPSFVPRGVEAIAKIKGLSHEEMTLQIRNNFRELFRL